MYKNDITSKALKEKIKFYRNMSNSESPEDPFDFKDLLITFAEIKNVCFRNCDFSGTIFINTSISNVTFIDCNLENTSFNNSDLTDVKIIKGSIAYTRFTNSKIGYITIQFAEISETRFDSCNIYALHMESTTVTARFLMTNCKVRIATLIGSVSAELPCTSFDMILAKNTTVELKNTEGLSINTLSPYHATFLPKNQVKVLKRVSKVILPDEYVMNAVQTHPTFHGYSKH